MTSTTTTANDTGTTTVTHDATQDRIAVAIDLIRAIGGWDMSGSEAGAAKKREALNAAYQVVIDALSE